MNNSNLQPGPQLINTQRMQVIRKPQGIARRASVPLLEQTKDKLFNKFAKHRTPEKDLAKDFGIRREEVELVIHERLAELLEERGLAA